MQAQNGELSGRYAQPRVSEVPHGRRVSSAPGTFPPESQKATDWLWNLPKSVEIRKRLAALRTTAAQKQAEERARVYRERIVEKARSGVYCRFQS